jgi:hypothetical protein
MAKETYTPVSFWLDMTIAEFSAWIEEMNRVMKDRAGR